MLPRSPAMTPRRAKRCGFLTSKVKEISESVESWVREYFCVVGYDGDYQVMVCKQELLSSGRPSRNQTSWRSL